MTFPVTLELVQRYRRALVLRDAGVIYREIGQELGYSREHAWSICRAAERWLETVICPPEAPTPHETPDVALVAWAAGFFDGEGCVFGYEDIQRGYRRFTFGIQVAQVKREPLDLLCETWGGSVRAQKKQRAEHQDQWAWGIRGEAGANFLSDLLPHLRVKHEAAQVAIPCLFRTHQHGVPFTDEEIVGRRAAISILKSLNRRGKAVT